jgi:hypothetical protein
MKIWKLLNIIFLLRGTLRKNKSGRKETRGIRKNQTKTAEN